MTIADRAGKNIARLVVWGFFAFFVLGIPAMIILASEVMERQVASMPSATITALLEQDRSYIDQGSGGVGGALVGGLLFGAGGAVIGHAATQTYPSVRRKGVCRVMLQDAAGAIYGGTYRDFCDRFFIGQSVKYTKKGDGIILAGSRLNAVRI